jgi:hypothetical protein
MSKHARTIVAGNPLLLAVAGIGFAVSFQTISHLATAHHLPGWPVLYPLGIDVGILALAVESRRAIDAGRSDLVPRVLAWVLAAFTIYVNAHGAPAHDWLGRAMHVVMPALWIVFLELTRWRKLAKKRAEDKREGIPLARWMAAPLSSLRMHRRMILRNTRSYAAAVELEDARRFIAAIARAHFGKRWKAEAPCILLDRIRSGRLGDDVTRAATASVSADLTGGWEEAARAMVAKAVTEGDQLAVSVRAERRRIGRQDDTQETAQDAPQPPAQSAPRTPSRAPSQKAPVSAVQRARRKGGRKATDDDIRDAIRELAAEVPELKKYRVMKELPVGDERAERLLAEVLAEGSVSELPRRHLAAAE